MQLVPSGFCHHAADRQEAERQEQSRLIVYQSNTSSLDICLSLLNTHTDAPLPASVVVVSTTNTHLDPNTAAWQDDTGLITALFDQQTSHHLQPAEVFMEFA